MEQLKEQTLPKLKYSQVEELVKQQVNGIEAECGYPHRHSLNVVYMQQLIVSASLIVAEAQRNADKDWLEKELDGLGAVEIDSHQYDNPQDVRLGVELQLDDTKKRLAERIREAE